MPPVLHASDLTKHYGAHRAVDGLDLRVEPGEVYAFLGRNGAGKTTTIRMVLGMIRPTRGRVSLFGEDVRDGHGPWHRTGHLVESPSAYPDLTVEENLQIVGRLRGLRDRQAVEDVIERFRLTRYATRKAGALSMGNLQRLGLAQALIHRPELVVLDEPTNALDPAGVVEIREMIVSLARDEGGTVFLSSHLLAEVAHVATRIGVLHEGRLVEELTAQALAQRPARLCVRVHRPGDCLPRTRGRRLPRRTAARRPGALAQRRARAGGTRGRRPPPRRRRRSPLPPGDRAGKPRSTFSPPHRGPAMTMLRAPLWAETLKARRSRMPLLTSIAFALGPLAGALFMVILKDPARARSWGLIRAKAQLTAGTATWEAYLSVLAQAVSVGGLIVFAIVAAWVFGREFTDRTLKNLLALPTSRRALVTAKFIVASGWMLGLTVLASLLGLGLGAAVGLPGGSASTIGSGLGAMLLSGVLTVLVSTPVAYVASLGRGYLAPLGWAFFTVFLAQIVAATGWGGWFPWSVPALLSGMAGPNAEPIGLHGYVVVGIASVGGLWATYRRWSHADHSL